MRIGAANLTRKLRLFAIRSDLVTVGEGHRALASGAGGRSWVALSMDDAYRDNQTDLLPILEQTGARAMDWDDARAIHGAGVEPGGHTVQHAILSRCQEGEALAETRGCAESMRRELLFAYRP